MSLELTHAFVITKNEGAIFNDRPTCRRSELIAAKRWNRAGRIVKKIPGVERAVAKKFIARAVELIAS